MTAKKDLKKRVRSRQQKTGERYTTALERVKQGSARRRRAPVVEVPDLSAIATAAGLKCRAYCSFPFWDLRTDEQERGSLARIVLERLREVLRKTEADASTARLRSALLHGRALSAAGAFGPGISNLRSFTERLRLGVRGTSEDGRAIAFEAPDPSGDAPLILVAMLWPSGTREPLLYLSLASEWLRAKPFLEGLMIVFGPTLSDAAEETR